MMKHNFPPADAPEKKEAAVPVLSGTVHRYFSDIRMGTIKSDDGQSYTFRRPEWLAEDEPKAGVRVSFEMNAETPVKIRSA